MFKLVVLCAFVAVAAAKPDLLVAAPLTYSTLVSPASTTITKQASSVIHPSPLLYSAPLSYAHFIKKRSPQFYIAPSTYLATNPLTATTYSAPWIQTSGLTPQILPATYTTAHLIKKRSAPVLATSYITPTTYAATAPLITSYAATTPLLSSTPVISSSLYSHPLAVAHLIKKRSAPLITTYVSPASVSHQSRIDLHSSTPYVTSYSTPYAYSSPIAYSHLI